jgi:hypothetical protein
MMILTVLILTMEQPMNVDMEVKDLEDLANILADEFGDDFTHDAINNNAIFQKDCEILAYADNNNDCACKSITPSSCFDMELDEDFINDIISALGEGTLESTNSSKNLRKLKIAKWLRKRERRNFAKKTICRARKVVADSRVRVSGRFVKTSSLNFVSITSMC